MLDEQEETIVEGCLKNDRLAQKALYDRYKTRMYTLTYRITGSFEDANDVLQEGFLQVFENLVSFKGEAKLGTWIHTIMARAALKKIKNRIQFIEINDRMEQATFEPVEYIDAVDTQIIEKAISLLPDGYRSIFTLFEIEGFKHREIAEMMNITESTSKTQLLKAKRMLVEKLRDKSI